MEIKIKNRKIICKSCSKETYSDLEKLTQDAENTDRAIFTCSCGVVNRIKKEGLCSNIEVSMPAAEVKQTQPEEIEW